MKKIFNHSTNWLWINIAVTSVLTGGKFIGVQWPLSPKVAFGRLLVYPQVAGIEVLFSAILLVLLWFSRAKPNWAIVATAIAAMVCAFYHLWNYLIGVEFFLLQGAGILIREFSKADK